ARANYVEGVSFYIQRENDSYKIPSLRRQMKKDEEMTEHEKSLLEQESETISQVEIMSVMLKDLSDIVEDKLKRKGIYVCVPDASDIRHRRKLRKALTLASTRRQGEDNKNAEETTSPRGIPEEIDPILFIQQSAAVAEMAFHRKSGDISDIFKNKEGNWNGLEIPPRRIIVAISFGAGHFSAGAYEQKFFERYGIVRLCGSSDDQLGGEDLNLKLGEWCMEHKDIQPYAEELKKNKRLLKFYRGTMELVKTDLSGLDPGIADIEVTEDLVVNIEVRRKDLLKACSDVFERIKEHLDSIFNYLADHNLCCTDVIYVGGSTRVVKFRELVESVFPSAVIIKSLNPDECQVLGTGLKAGIRDGIHRLAYAECQDTAMDDCYVTLDGVKFYLTKKGESVQNAPERWIKTVDGSKEIPYPDDDNNNLDKKKKLNWTPDVDSDVRLMIRNYPVDK
ncbi:hypothetical protein FO519_010167, partial [Halicephalobus sp. NKZ332]